MSARANFAPAQSSSSLFVFRGFVKNTICLLPAFFVTENTMQFVVIGKTLDGSASIQNAISRPEVNFVSVLGSRLLFNRYNQLSKPVLPLSAIHQMMTGKVKIIDT